MAAAATFGTEFKGHSGKKNSVKMTLENVRDHDSALTEAQELLQNWMQEKVLSELNEEENADDLDDLEQAGAENWSERRKTKADVKREWDHLVEQTEIDYGIIDPQGISHRSGASATSYYSLLENDPDSLVNEIMSNMMEKDLVKKKHLGDLEMEDKKKIIDPHSKMKLRQEQVKLTRDKRLKQLERLKREKQVKKDAQFQARQMIKQEEQKKMKQEKKEEEAIQREMLHIRKEMAEEKKMKQELARKEKEESQRQAAEPQEDDRMVSMEMRKEWADKQKEEERQRKIRRKIAQMEARTVQENLKLQRRCFQAWFNIVAQNRLQLGKAKALSDWRLMMKTFNAWHSYSRSQRLSAEALLHQEQVIETNRKWSLAANHHRLHLLRLCFGTWQIFVTQCQHQKELEQQEVNKRNKMAAFLQVAMAGQLWNEGSAVQSSSSELSIVPNSAREKVDMLFDQAPRPQGLDNVDRFSVRSDLTARSQRSRSSERSRKKVMLPSDTTQVKREHLNLTSQQIASLTGGAVNTNKQDVPPEGSSSPPNPQMGSNTGNLRERRFSPNTMEHRHRAQQKLLENQQKQIAEQHRLIEELQYLQRQQLLQQQVTNQQLIQQLVNNKAGDSGAQNNFNPHHLAEHIEKLQKELAEMKLGQNLGQEVEGQHTQEVHHPPVPRSAWVDSARTDVSSITNVTARTGSGSARTDVTLQTSASSREGTNITKPDSAKHRAFLQSMEERAAERARIKKEREEKKRKEEDEQLARLLVEQEELRKKDEEDKRQKMEMYREKKRLEKLKEAKKQAALEKLQHQMQMAAEHSDLATVKYRGWLPWRRLVSMARERQEKAKEHHEHCNLRKHLLSWHLFVAKEVAEKNSIADEFHNYSITRWCFSSWKMFRHSAIILEQKADRWHSNQLLLKIVRAWWDWAESEKIAMRQKERIAKEHNVERIKKTAFRAWKRFPEMLRKEIEREKRKGDLRKKVSNLLSDYKAPPPPSASASSNLDDFFKF